MERSEIYDKLNEIFRDILDNDEIELQDETTANDIEEWASVFLTYHYTDPTADFYAENPHPDAFGHFHYDLHYPGGILEDVCVGAPGWVNAENSVAAAAIALTYGLDPQAVKHAIGTFAISFMALSTGRCCLFYSESQQFSIGWEHR